MCFITYAYTPQTKRTCLSVVTASDIDGNDIELEDSMGDDRMMIGRIRTQGHGKRVHRTWNVPEVQFQLQEKYQFWYRKEINLDPGSEWVPQTGFEWVPQTGSEWVLQTGRNNVFEAEVC